MTNDLARFESYLQKDVSIFLRHGIIKFTFNSDSKSVRLRYKVNNLERSEEQIKRAAQMSEDRAIILAAEVLSSTIGTTISISLIIWSYYHHLETQKEEKEKEENEMDEKLSKIRDLINSQNEKLANLQSLISSLESKIASIEKSKEK